MSIRIQQKSDEYKHQFSNLMDDFNSKEQELQKQVKALQVIFTSCTQYIQPFKENYFDSEALSLGDQFLFHA